MATQEEYVNDVLALRRQGLTVAEIAAQIGYHPATVSKWLRAGGPPPAREVAPSQRVVDDRWQARIAELVTPPSRLLATSVFEVLAAEGFDGSYPSVARAVRALRGPRFRPAMAASVSIETAPGEVCQFDWSDCSSFTEAWGLGEVWCFGAILCWSRWRQWWFATSVDREHTFEALVSFFEAAGGVTKLARTDRMGALDVSQGQRFRLHPPALDFARHHGTEIVACQAGDAARNPLQGDWALWRKVAVRGAGCPVSPVCANLVATLEQPGRACGASIRHTMSLGGGGLLRGTTAALSSGGLDRPA